jgi:hypothetical protein
VIRKWPRIHFSTGFCSRSGFSSANASIRMPVNSRNAPNSYRIKWKRLMSQAPTTIITVRSTMAPSTP